MKRETETVWTANNGTRLLKALSDGRYGVLAVNSDDAELLELRAAINDALGVGDPFHEIREALNEAFPGYAHHYEPGVNGRINYVALYPKGENPIYANEPKSLAAAIRELQFELGSMPLPIEPSPEALDEAGRELAGTL